jgi:hypothetical protein
MADRNYVMRRVGPTALQLLVSVAIALARCSDAAPPQETVNRGQVLDQDTGKPITGAIVVGKYLGSMGAGGASSCNRVESAVSDANGWFELPLDPKAGPLAMEAYHRGYRYGWPVRVAECDPKGNCTISQQRRDANDQVVSIVREPTIYHGWVEAMAASREGTDVYLKKSEGTPEERFRVLWGLEGATSCLARAKTTPGLEPLLEAILQEQIELGDSPDAIRVTRERIETARKVQKQR